MRIKTENLNFLDLYVLGADTKNIMHDKIQIKTDAENNLVTLTQQSKNVFFITELKEEVDEDFELILPTVQFNQLVKSSKKDEYIEINKSGIKFNSGSYELEQYSFDYSSTQEVLDIIKTKECDNKYTINSLENIKVIKPFIGEDTLATVALMNNNFVVSNKEDATGAIRTRNKIDDIVYLSELTSQLCILADLRESDFYFYKEDNFYFFKINQTHIITVIQDYALPNIFDEEIINSFMHKNKVILDKEEFSKALQRISIIASKNLEGRIHLSLKDSKMLIESKEDSTGYALETIAAKIDPDINNQELVVSVNYLNNMLSSLYGKEICILVEKEDEESLGLAITLEDETKERFFIHCLYETLD